mmetsp:Transcript_15850/g.32230  ORF Transcript_15850/g.32230 Transcript_15850/m.32230 type:complete len:342 (+) Transcript_15850:92-1117(+)|eukprot:CAMPEP_0167786674 /NCGR_PEP_ID=MMETSP0111_2-20121227/8950_1 /TAXON_ID=91324 /ORGANISM="Lotharella globosa, Strain CCCM811" /LENGTH=341 /DNA_ID=CAMNT_0007678135 /DNA_START=49 /DNA_END=1074 /DNA_ORIENTATION=-
MPVYDTFGSELLDEEVEIKFSKKTCLGQTSLCSLTVMVMIAGALFCFFATCMSVYVGGYNRVMLWATFLGVMAHIVAGIAMVSLFRQYRANCGLQTDIQRLEHTVSVLQKQNKNMSEGKAGSRAKLLDRNASVIQMAKNTGKILKTVTTMEGDYGVSNNDDLMWFLMELKKAALTQEAALMQQFATELKLVPKKSRKLTEMEWEKMIMRMPCGAVPEIDFNIASQGARTLSWERARLFLEAFIRARMLLIMRALDETDCAQANLQESPQGSNQRRKAYSARKANSGRSQRRPHTHETKKQQRGNDYDQGHNQGGNDMRRKSRGVRESETGFTNNSSVDKDQ